MIEELPTPIQVDILSRVGCSTDLASCRLACRTFRSLSYEIRAVRLVCSRARLVRSRAGAVTPFKSVVRNLATVLHGHGRLESLYLAVQPDFVEDDDDYNDDVEERSDLHITSDGFVWQWLPILAPSLLELSFSDHWPQSCWRKSLVLSCISSCCQMLTKLEIKYAWLSVEGLKPLLTLKMLTLEFIRLDDTQLNKINECFPSLEVLELISVGGLDKPEIRLEHLRCCHWNVTNVPSALAIEAPSLLELQLKCVKPNTLILRTPLLCTLNLMVEKEVTTIELGSLLNLACLRIEATKIGGLIQMFQGCSSVRNLEIVVPVCKDLSAEIVSLKDLVSLFPDLSCLKLSPGIRCNVGNSSIPGSTRIVAERRNLRKLAVPLQFFEIDTSFASHIMNMCPFLSAVNLLVPNNAFGESHRTLLSTFKKIYPKVTWNLEYI